MTRSGLHLQNAYVKCVFNTSIVDQDGILPLDYKWAILYNVSVNMAQFPVLTLSVGQLLIVVSSCEFLYAQSLHCMKGLLFGLVVGSLGIFTAIAYIAHQVSLI